MYDFHAKPRNTKWSGKNHCCSNFTLPSTPFVSFKKFKFYHSLDLHCLNLLKSPFINYLQPTFTTFWQYYQMFMNKMQDSFLRMKISGRSQEYLAAWFEIFQICWCKILHRTILFSDNFSWHQNDDMTFIVGPFWELLGDIWCGAC